LNPSPGVRSILTVTRTRIKICGITRIEDAWAAAQAGADAIGLVLHRQAGRFVGPETARGILDALPPFVTAVGLFVDESAEGVLATARELGLRHVQLHGDEGPEFVRELVGLAVVKAVHVDATFPQTLGRWHDPRAGGRLPMLKGLVLETARVGSATGGTGVANDWGAVRHQLDAGSFNGLPSIIAAGGLTPETVGEVVRSIRPYAVDVSSGVEGPVRGQKSVERIEAFVRAVRDADAAEQG
jgi:phosphoribosylanthranilate isomerase